MRSTTFTHPDRAAADVVGALSAAGYETGAAAPLRRTLLDTFDRRLRERGLRLELREGKSAELVLADAESPPAHVSVAVAPRFVTDLAPGPFRARLASIVDVRALLPLAEISAAHTPVAKRNRSGKTELQLSVYEDLRVGGDAATPSWAVELDALPGYEKAAAQAQRVLDALGLDESEGDVLDLPAALASVERVGFDSSPTVAFAAGETALDGYRRVLVHLAGAVQANWEGTVDDVDPEFLHDFRVAVRRTRSVLAQAKRVLPDDVRAAQREAFAWLGEITGRARDLDVYVIEWPSYLAPLGDETRSRLEPVFDHLVRQRALAHKRLAGELSSPRYAQLVQAWAEWLDGQASGGADAERPIAEVASRRIRQAQRTIVDGGRAIDPTTPPAELHELRKDAKRLRYLIECFGGLYEPGRRRAFVKVLKTLQDNLGEHQDAGVHVEQLRVVSEELHERGDAGPEVLLAMGELTGHLEQRRAAARAEFAERFAAYDSKETTRRLRALLESAGR